jgi:Photosystem II protein Y (PsbY)
VLYINTGFLDNSKCAIVLRSKSNFSFFYLLFFFLKSKFYKFNSDLESLNLLIIIYSVFNLNISKGLSFMDTRLLVIAAPLLVAASWALFNIGRLAIQQIQRLTR